MTEVGNPDEPIVEHSLDDLLRAAFRSPAPPASAAPSAILSRAGANYRIVGEIARGGMGVILQGRDEQLARDVAVKVLRPEFAQNQAMLARFVEEAHIAGQLQHPGIVPIYELGRTADGRPYFAMKWIRGRTLAELLAERRSASAERHRFIAIFEQICQSIAYAHSRRVVHRDLKPSNVMIGSFGEVQVLDWGIAKLLGSPGPGDSSSDAQSLEGLVDTPRMRGEPTADSVHGQVMGTPAYMPPEQARGDVARIDERSDVFALGGILCEILTGRAPYLGDSDSARVAASSGAIDEAFARLDLVDDAPELVALSKRCLAPDPSSRPESAADLAREIGDYRASVEERAQAAQIAAAAAQVREFEARKARRLTLALAASVLLLVFTGVGARMWVQRLDAERRDRSYERVNAALDRATLAFGRASSSTDLELWHAAVAEVEHAESAVDTGEHIAELDQRTRDLAERVRAGAREAEQRAAHERSNREFAARLEELRAPESETLDQTDWSKVDADYAAAFKAQGLDVESRATPELAAEIRGREIASELIGALDEWTQACRRANRRERAARLFELAAATDTDATRAALRDALSKEDATTLAEFARTADLRRLPVPSLTLLGGALEQLDQMPESERVLRVAIELRPSDFVSNVYLARAVRDHDYKDAARYLAAALAVRPNDSIVIHDYGWILDHYLNESERSVALYRAHLTSNSNDATLRVFLGHALVNLGRFDEAIDAYSDALRIEPSRESARTRRLECRIRVKDFDAGFREAREVLETDPKSPDAHYFLGECWLARGELAAAANEFRSSGIVVALDRLSEVLAQLGDADGSVRAARQSISSWPAHLLVLFDLGLPIGDWIELDDSIANFRAAVRKNPQSPTQRALLGVLLREKGLYTESSFELVASDELGSDLGRWIVPAEDPFVEAKRLIFRERRSSAWAVEADRLARLESRLERVVRGDESPVSLEESAEFGHLALRRGMALPAARLYAKAIDPAESSANDAIADQFVDATVAAATVGFGSANPDERLDPADRAEWRARAERWMRADLTRLSALADRGTVEARVRAVRAIGRWRNVPGLEGLRSAKAMASLDDAERRSWSSDWADLDALAARIRAQAAQQTR